MGARYLLLRFCDCSGTRASQDGRESVVIAIGSGKQRESLLKGEWGAAEQPALGSDGGRGGVCQVEGKEEPLVILFFLFF